MENPASPVPSLDRAGVEAIWKEVLGLSEIGPDRSFVDLGGSSLRANMIVALLAQRMGLDVPVIRVFEYPTLRQFQRFLAGEPAAAPLPPSTTYAVAETQDGSAGNAPGHDIAIVGMACRFPGARDLEEFWSNLVEGRDTISQLREDEISPAVPAEIRNDPRYVRAAGLIDEPYAMDAAFFDIPPMEARLTDPQHRVLLELSWQALENAGHAPGSIRGRTAVFAGTEDNSYYKTEIHPYPEAEARAGRFSVMTGNEKDFVAMRIAHRLDLRGPAVSVHTACSTSLVAVIMACKSLRLGECEMALAGGAAVHFPTPEGYYFQEGGVFSSDGHCRPFDQGAEGTVFTDGAGMVVLKRVEDAIRDRDTIYAVIKGGAVNNDGGDKVSFSAPSVRGQAACIAEALRDAGVGPDSLGYLEAHGTATPVGDPIEMEGLRQAFGDRLPRRQFCGLGSVKSNIGHTTAAAGVASLIKVALSLHHAVLPASLHFRRPNPALDIENSPFYVVDSCKDWPRGAQVRRAGVSSFGIGGTNSHAVLEEAPLPAPDAPAATEPPARPFEILPVSARGAAQRDRLLAGLALESAPLRDFAYTLQQGRARFGFRGAAVRLPAFAQADATVAPAVAALEDPGITFLFPGQGSQYIGMGRSLSAHLPEFRQHFSHCCRLLSAELELDFEAFLFDPSNQETLENTRFTQPALFAIETSLGRMLLDWGIRPERMIGHSIGEFAAAHLAGVFSLEDGVRMIAARGRLMAALPRGRMLSVRAPEQAALAACGEAIDIASINSPVHCVLAGPDEAIARAQARLEAAGMPCRPLHTSHAFHSEMMAPVVDPFLEVVRSVTLAPPRMRIISSVTGEPMRDTDATDPAYWARHLRATVRFSPALQVAIGEGARLFLEVGPRATLATLATQHLTQDSKAGVSVAALADSPEPEVELGAIAGALARLWTAGYELPWQAIWTGGRRVPLRSTYPFERKNFRFSEGRGPAAARPVPAAAVPAAIAPAPLAPANAVVPAGVPVPAAGFDPTLVLLQDLRTLFSEFAGMAVEQDGASFIEIGFDSLVLMQIGVELGKRYGVSVSLGDLMRKHNTLALLSAHLAATAAPARLPQAPAVIAPAASVPAAPVLAPAPAAASPLPVAQPAAPCDCSATALPAAMAVASMPQAGATPLTPADRSLALVIDAQMRQMREVFELQLRYARLAPDAQMPGGHGASSGSPSTGLATPSSSTGTTSAGAGSLQAWGGGSAVGGLARWAPLSVMQERIRFLEELNPGRPVYNVPSLHRLRGPLQERCFAQALRQVIAHQPALRTRIARDPQGAWSQQIEADVAYSLPFEDLVALPAAERERALRQAVEEIVSRPVAMDRAPMFHAMLWKIDADTHVFAFVAHHLVWDGWSFDLLLDELGQCYAGLVQGRTVELAPLATGPGDFPAWQSQWLQAEAAQAQKAYWKGLFRSLPRPAAAPTDHPRRAGRSGRAGLERLQIDARQAGRLHEIARSGGSTLSMLMLAAYAAVVSQSLGLEDIVVGLTVRGRREARFEPVMGFFNNLLPLPLHVDRSQSFLQWMSALGATMADAFEHQDVPFEVLASEPELAQWARASGVPYHALISFQDARRRTQDWGGIARDSLPVEQAFATEDFGLWVTETQDGIELRLVYDAELFDAGSAAWMRSRLQILLERVQRTSEQDLAALLALGPHEQARIDELARTRDGARVLGPDGKDAPIGVMGRLCIAGQEQGQRARWRSDGKLEQYVPPVESGADRTVRSPDDASGTADARAAPARPAAADSAERLVSEVWSQVLGVATIRPTDNFFELGGSSLQAMQAATLLEQSLGRPVNARKFTTESLRSFARDLDREQAVPSTARPAGALVRSVEAEAHGARLRGAPSGGMGALRRLLRWLTPGESQQGRIEQRARPMAPAPSPAIAPAQAVRAAGTPASVEACACANPGECSAAQDGSGLRRARHAQPPVPGAFRDPLDPEGGKAWYRRNETTGEYETL